MISEKKYRKVHISSWCKSQQGTRKNYAPKFIILSALNLPSCGLVVFINMKTYLLTEGRNSKTFLKRNKSIPLNSCYISWN